MSLGERERGDSTPFADLNELLAKLVAGATEVLGDSFCGAYLQGSFAVGGSGRGAGARACGSDYT